MKCSKCLKALKCNVVIMVKEEEKTDLHFFPQFSHLSRCQWGLLSALDSLGCSSVELRVWVQEECLLPFEATLLRSPLAVGGERTPRVWCWRRAGSAGRRWHLSRPQGEAR